MEKGKENIEKKIREKVRKNGKREKETNQKNVSIKKDMHSERQRGKERSKYEILEKEREKE